MVCVKQSSRYDFPSACDVCKRAIIGDDQMYSCLEHGYDR